MRTFGHSDYRSMPWKNGGGTTVELYVASSGPDGFDWRVSIAAVSEEGPFSLFAGYDRAIMLIEGNGMVLEGGPEGPIAVAPAYVPKSFSGDWNIRSRLLDGPVRDFNLISRRSAVSAQLRCEAFEASRQFGGAKEWTYVYLLSGSAEMAGSTLALESSILLEPGEACQVLAKGGTATMAVCNVRAVA